MSERPYITNAGLRANQVYGMLISNGERAPQELINIWNWFPYHEKIRSKKYSPSKMARDRYHGLVRHFPNRIVYETLILGAQHKHIHPGQNA